MAPDGSGASSSSSSVAAGRGARVDEEKACPAERYAIPGSEQALLDGNAVDRGAVVAIEIDDAKTVICFLEAAMLARDVLGLEDDVVFGLAPGTHGVRLELDDMSGRRARKRDEFWRVGGFH